MDIALDSTGDLAFEAGLFSTTTGTEEVAQRLTLALDSQRGEWFLDETWGVRYFDRDENNPASILVKDPNIPVIVSELKAIILGVEGVASLLSFRETFSPSVRSLSVVFSVLTDEDETIEAVVLVGDEEDALFAPAGSAIAIQILSIGGLPCRA